MRMGKWVKIEKDDLDSFPPKGVVVMWTARLDRLAKPAEVREWKSWGGWRKPPKINKAIITGHRDENYSVTGYWRHTDPNDYAPRYENMVKCEHGNLIKQANDECQCGEWECDEHDWQSTIWPCPACHYIRKQKEKE